NFATHVRHSGPDAGPEGAYSMPAQKLVPTPLVEGSQESSENSPNRGPERPPGYEASPALTSTGGSMVPGGCESPRPVTYIETNSDGPDSRRFSPMSPLGAMAIAGYIVVKLGPRRIVPCWTTTGTRLAVLNSYQRTCPASGPPPLPSPGTLIM